MALFTTLKNPILQCRWAAEGLLIISPCVHLSSDKCTLLCSCSVAVSRIDCNVDCWCENGNTCTCPLVCMLICGFVKSLWSFFVFHIYLIFFAVYYCRRRFQWVCCLPAGCSSCCCERVCISVHTNTTKRVNVALHQLQADSSLRGLMSRLKHDWFGEGCFGENIATQMRSDAVWATAWIQPHSAFAETQRPDIWADIIFITVNMMTDIKFSLLTPKIKTVIYLPSCC